MANKKEYTLDEALATIEEQTKVITELKGKVERGEDDIQREVNKRLESIAAGAKLRVVIPGTVTLKVENAAGAVESVVVGVTDGVPSFTDGGVSFGTDQILRLANGEKLAESDLAKFPAMATLTPETAKAKLTSLFAKGAGFLKRVAAVLVLGFMFSLLLPTQADAQVRDGRFEVFAADTLTNAETVYIYFGKTIWDFANYDYTIQFVTTNISGTSTVSINTQQSLIETGTANSLFVDIDTTAFSGSTTKIIQNDVKGIRLRWKCTSSGTGVTRFYAVLRVRKKKSVE